MARADVLHWTPIDYLGDRKTWGLTLEEHGAYCLLLWHMWTTSDAQCEFPLDYKALSVIWHTSPEEAMRLAEILTDEKYGVVKVKTRRGIAYMHSKRLEEQANQARIYREKQAEKGRKSGIARSNNARTTVEQRFDCGSTTNEPTETRKHVTRKRVARAGSSALIETLQGAYHDKRWKQQSAQAIETFIESGGDAELLLATLPLVPATHNQSLRYLIEDGTWQQFAPRSKPRPCSNPECVSGHIIVDGAAVPCPDCNGGAS